VKFRFEFRYVFFRLVGVVTRIDKPACKLRKGEEIFRFSKTSVPDLELNQLPIQWAVGLRCE
jgi:hypothetical protein